MRVLVSAYACEPNKGSEQEVGWQRALHLACLADETWVVTRANNREVIEADPSSHADGLHFVYYDLPRWALRLKRRPFFLYAYFALWQWGAYRAAARQHRLTPFDVVYHVTFVSLLPGSFMGRLGIPLVVGPVAGGERAPLRLRRGMPWRSQMSELRRDIAIELQRYNPLARPALRAAHRIFVTSPESLRLIARKWLAKTEIQLGIAMDTSGAPREPRAQHAGGRFVFIGRLLHWKGAHLAMRALAQARQDIPDATLTLYGTGPGERWLRDVAKGAGVESAVRFLGHVPRRELQHCLADFSALVFPSLHDSGGMAVLECLSQGMPVICLNLGGPGVMVTDSCGLSVPVKEGSEAEIVGKLARAMVSMATMPPDTYRSLSAGAVARARELSWAALTARVSAVCGPANEAYGLGAACTRPE